MRALILRCCPAILPLWAAASLPAQPAPDWTVDLGYRSTFQRILNDRIAIIGTERHTYCLDLRTGRVRWRFRNFQIRAEDLVYLQEQNLLLVAEGWGGPFRDEETTFLAIDLESGQARWESSAIEKRALTMVTAADGKYVLVVAAARPSGKAGDDLERALEVFYLNAATGVITWSFLLREPVELAPTAVTFAGKDDEWQAFSLASYQEPRLKDGRVYFFYHGIRCHDSKTGRFLWEVKMAVRERKDWAGSYPEPFIDEKVLYLAARGTLYAVAAGNGQILWERNGVGLSGAVLADDEYLYLQLGGRVRDLDDDELKWAGPFGIVVFRRLTGEKVWYWRSAEDSIANPVIFGDRVYLADEDRLYALDRYTGKRLYKLEHGFRNRPIYAGLTESDKLVLIGQEDSAAFRYQDGRRLWHHQFSPPGGGFWRKFMGGLLSTTGVILTVGSYGVAAQRDLLPALPSLVNRILGYPGRAIRLGRAAGSSLFTLGGGLLQQSHFAQLSGNHQYYFSEKSNGWNEGIVGVNLNSGRIDHFLALDPQDRQVIVNEPLQQVLVTSEDTMRSYSLERSIPPHLQRQKTNPAENN